MKKSKVLKIRYRPEDEDMRSEIRVRANYSLALLGMGFVYHGSGRFLNLRHPRDDLECPREDYVAEDRRDV